MINRIHIYSAQLNATVGATGSNVDGIKRAYENAVKAKADLVLTPELSVIGYPPEDLVLKPAFQHQARCAVEDLAAITKGGPGLIIGAPWVCDGNLYNAVVLLEDGGIADVYLKQHLPNYGVFDEVRIFTPATNQKPLQFRGISLGVMICEDMWFNGPASNFAAQGAEILLVPTCSPYDETKEGERRKHAASRCQETKLPLVFCNQIGGQDELVFDGASFVMDAAGIVTHRAKCWQEDGALITLNKQEDGRWVPVQGAVEPDVSRLEAIYNAAVLGLADYVRKNRFPGVVLGMSGGVDSALSAAIAVDALGADRVHCVMMPSKYTSGESLGDAEECATLLGAPYDSIAIKDGVDAFDRMLSDAFQHTVPDTTEENIQSRLRGLILMSLSNKFGKMVLTTGNKSEMSVGYATLYGDMCGGYNALKDIYKLDVFALCHWRNQNWCTPFQGPKGRVIPENIIIKPPTAELREDQKDEDSLPCYEVLDVILRGLVDEEMSVMEIAEKHAFDASEVARIEHLLYIAEYKRRQAPPGVKITHKNFGRDRRYPITNGYRSAKP